MAKTKRVLLGQLASNGDCVYATTVARQIKQDLPGCHLTWAIGSAWSQVIEGNPHVDDVWVVDVPNRSQLGPAWRQFVLEARRREREGEFDEVYLTQIFPDNYKNYDGTVRASIFRGYPRPIRVPVTPIVRLTDDERARADEFIRLNSLERAGDVVLFEIGPRSGQSFVTLEWALSVSRALVQRRPGTVVVLSSSESVDAEPGIVDGSQLRYRENAELTKVCSLLVGCSSGITWLCTSDAAKPLPTVQFLSRSVGAYGAVAHDLEYWGLPTEHVVEMEECKPDLAAEALCETLEAGPARARVRFGRHFRPTFDAYFELMISQLARGNFHAATSSVRCTIQRYGFDRSLISGAIGGCGRFFRRQRGRFGWREG